MTQTMTMNQKLNTVTIARGEIWEADLREGNVGSEQGGVRPVLIIQNDIGNKYSSTVLVAPFTSKTKNSIPTHVDFTGEDCLDRPSTLMVEQMRTIDKSRLLKFYSNASDKKMEEVNKAIQIQTAIANNFSNEKAFDLLSDIFCLRYATKDDEKESILKDLLAKKNKIFNSYCEEFRINSSIIISNFKKNKRILQ